MVAIPLYSVQPYSSEEHTSDSAMVGKLLFYVSPNTTRQNFNAGGQPKEFRGSCVSTTIGEGDKSGSYFSQKKVSKRTRSLDQQKGHLKQPRTLC